MNRSIQSIVGALFCVMIGAPAPAPAQSTINTGQPATQANLTSLIVRQQFQAAASDINGLLSKHASTSVGQCPAAPYVGEDCLTVGSTPYVWNVWTGGGAGWMRFATINPSTGAVSIALNSADITNAPPVTVNFGSGLATVGLNFNSTLALDGSNNLGINLANPNVFTATQTFPNGSINNAELANSTISGVALGSALPALTFGTHLTGVSYNGSGAVTLGTDATSTNTPSTIVARDASGNFSAGAIMVGANLALSIANSISAGSNTAISSLDVGQDSSHLLAINWLWNATPSAASAQIATTGFLNPITIDASTLTLQGSSGGPLKIGANTISLGGAFSTAGAYTMSGAFGFTGTLTGSTAVTFPIAGTLATLAGAETFSNKTLVAPALGTPSSGIATNLTGTAAGLTAGTVTTNANLTGPITSTGNATAIASQTGTGTRFVMDTSPTIATPIFSGNVGIGTSTPQSLLHVNSNATQNVPSVIGGIEVSLADASTGGIQINAFGSANPQISMMAAGGTAASKTAIGSGSFLFILDAEGYSGSVYSGQGLWGSVAAETWTNTARGTYAVVHTTPTGTTTRTEAIRIQPSGGLSVGTTTDPGTGFVLANKAVQSVPLTVATLPVCAAGTKGARAFVTDNNTALTFAGAITSGGANQTPVYCDGSVWRQG